jgi:hypothetical protein
MLPDRLIVNYCFQAAGSADWRLQQFTLTQPNSINILWLVPQEKSETKKNKGEFFLQLTKVCRTACPDFSFEFL